MQRIKSFEAHDSQSLSTQINTWLQVQAQENISVKIMQIINLKLEEGKDQKTNNFSTGYAFSVLVLYQ